MNTKTLNARLSNTSPVGKRATRLVCVVVGFFLALGASGELCAGEINIKKLARSIFLSENSASHPYGILKSYCKPNDPDGQCLKGCVQTIRKRLKTWDKTEDFITYLSRSYAPIGSKNDPTNLNKNWIKNVRYFYEKDMRLL
jgi:hypothetical protein